MGRIIMHIDLNAFFATVECLRDPSLVGKPIIVGHSGRSGIVSTCSYEARKFGVHSGQPTFQALRLCPDALVIEPHYRDYEVYSRSFFSYVRAYSGKIEVASIDECYADMTEKLKGRKDMEGYLRKMQLDIKEKTGLSCSIGIAATKWLAKMGSDLKKPMGLVFIRRKDIPSIIYPLPIESFWGIGKKSTPHLRKMGINTIGDLAKRIDETEIVNFFGKYHFTIKEWIEGRGSDEISEEPFDPKSVGVSQTLNYDCQGLDEVRLVLKEVCQEVSRRAKKEGKRGTNMTLTVKDTSFHLHTKAKSFDAPVDDADTLYKGACELYKKSYDDMEVRLVGVTLGKLVTKGHETIQMSLWNYEQYEEEDKTRLLIADLNKKLDKPSIMRLSDAKKDKK